MRSVISVKEGAAGMEASRPVVALFMGDPDDPWAESIAQALPAQAGRTAVRDDLPEEWPLDGRAAQTLVVHRPALSNTDLARLGQYKQEGRFERLILCVGPHARFFQLERAGGLVDQFLSEATAAEVIGRHIAPECATPRTDGPGPPVVVLSGLHDMRTLMAECCQAGGFEPIPARTWAEVPPGAVTVWDVPVLEPNWPSELAQNAPGRAVVTLIGLADRALVASARRHGARACLDVPFDPADLTWTLDRLVAEGPPEAGPPRIPPSDVGGRVPRPHLQLYRPEAGQHSGGRRRPGRPEPHR